MAQAGQRMPLSGVPVFEPTGVQQCPKLLLEGSYGYSAGQAHDWLDGVQFGALLPPPKPQLTPLGDTLQRDNGAGVQHQPAIAAPLASPLLL